MKWSLGTLAVLVTAVAVGCGGGEPQPADDTTAAVVRGRAFHDTSEVGDRSPSIDPELLTPEYLAKNPLRMGTEKRAPFVMAEGADPLDPSSYGWDRDDDGHWVISYSDLSLTDTDKELLLDALVYPDEYEGEEVHFPDRIRALNGQEVALTGYMIPIAWDETRVPHFMLVRDLLQCCFGGAPEPDEWVDVQTVGQGATYLAFVPVVVRGTFTLAGHSDEAGYATGAFSIACTDARGE